jgi:hypothetical protein
VVPEGGLEVFCASVNAAGVLLCVCVLSWACVKQRYDSYKLCPYQGDGKFTVPENHHLAPRLPATMGIVLSCIRRALSISPQSFALRSMLAWICSTIRTFIFQSEAATNVNASAQLANIVHVSPRHTRVPLLSTITTTPVSSPLLPLTNPAFPSSHQTTASTITSIPSLWVVA